MVFSFLHRRDHPLRRCIKKIADQPCYNVIFYLRNKHKTAFFEIKCTFFGRKENTITETFCMKYNAIIRYDVD